MTMQVTGENIRYLHTPDAMGSRGFDSRCLSARSPLRLPPRGIRVHDNLIARPGSRSRIAVESPCVAQAKNGRHQHMRPDARKSEAFEGGKDCFQSGRT
jgi:hypothetical protein